MGNFNLLPHKISESWQTSGFIFSRTSWKLSSSQFPWDRVTFRKKKSNNKISRCTQTPHHWVHHWWFTTWLFSLPRLFQGRMGASSFMLIFLSSYGSLHPNCPSTSLEETFSLLERALAPHCSASFPGGKIWLCHFSWDFELGKINISQIPVT